MEKDYIRTPIVKILRRSPIAGLERHFRYVRTGVKALERTVKSYLDEDYDNFKKFAEKVYKSEDQADRIKANIRNHLPKFIFIPIDKGDFLVLLKEADGILDTAEDVAVLMEMKHTTIPENMKVNFKEVMKKAINIVYTLGKALDLFHFMLESSLGGKTRQEIKNVIHSIHKLEHESDRIEKKLSKQLFNSKNLDPISILHLLKIIDRMGCMADHAENAADMIRAMLAK